MKDFATSDDRAVQAQLDRLARLHVPQGRLGLDTTRALLERLGNPHHAMPPVFHVAGTNGKGSVCAFLRAMLEAQGYTVHVTSSPHLVRYNERIRIAGTLIGNADLAQLLAEVLDAGEQLAPSFFEVTIAAAFLAFSRTPADACVVEVGLGGRFDATNVLMPDAIAACGIAALGLDHEKFLLAPEEGTPKDPLVRIAFEKAGIAKAGAPLVAIEYSAPVTREVQSRAAISGAPLALCGQDWAFTRASGKWRYHDRQGDLDLPAPALAGHHQIANAALAVAMLRHQEKLPVSAIAFTRAMKAVSWPARLQWLGSGPLADMLPAHRLLLDGGHNPAAGAVLKAFLLSTKISPVHAIMGMLASKDAAGFLQEIGPLIDTFIAVPLAGHDCIPPAILAQIASDAGASSTGSAKNIHEAAAKLAQGTPGREAGSGPSGGTVLLGGSLYLAGEILRANREYPR